MTKLKIIFFFILIATFNSCKNNSFHSDTETYKIELKKVSSFQSNFKNRIQEKPLNINAEKISLKVLFGLLIKTDTSDIKFENKKMNSDYYSLIIEQKEDSQSVNEAILNDLLHHWNLKLNADKYKSYEIKIQDSLSYFTFTSHSSNKTSKFVISKDSIKVTNCDLQKIVELINSEFSETTIYNGESKRIDYSWKKNSI